MDFDAQHRKRMEELEAKRKRLEEMRKTRKDRNAEEAKIPPPPELKHMDNKADIDNLVNSLLVSDAPEANSKTLMASLDPALKIICREDAICEKAKTLGMNRSLVGINIYPVQRECYDKGCQKDNDVEYESEENPLTTPMKSTAITPLSKATRMRSQSNTSETPIAVPEPVLPAEKPPKKVLSANEQQEILESATFNNFLESASTVLERALCQTESSFDYLRDYKGDTDSMINSTENRALHLTKQFTDVSLGGRPVMDLQACPHYPELFLAAYGSIGQTLHHNNTWGVFSHAPPQATSTNNASPSDAAGVVCVWSLALPTRPEFLFTATSPVLSAMFHPHDQHLVIGGCYSGQILLWDMRAKTLPVQRSNLAGRGHKHPVYSMHGVDASSSSNELITSSTDGMVCHWDLAQLSEPTFSNHVSFSSRADGSIGNNIVFDAPPSLKSACITSMAFGQTDGVRELFLGTDSGKLLKTALPIRAKDSSTTQINAHLGLLTSINPHTSNSRIFKNLTLTSSLDWTVKLWNLNQSNEPIMDFFTPTFDYVCGVQWSPVNPPLFSTITSGGVLSLWNVVKSTVEPLDTLSINKSGVSGGSASKGATSAFNKFTWLKDGRKIVAGDANGALYLISVQDGAALGRSGDEAKFEHILFSSQKETP